jgi:hypothetical protein
MISFIENSYINKVLWILFVKNHIKVLWILFISAIVSLIY